MLVNGWTEWADIFFYKTMAIIKIFKNSTCNPGYSVWCEQPTHLWIWGLLQGETGKLLNDCSLRFSFNYIISIKDYEIWSYYNRFISENVKIHQIISLFCINSNIQQIPISLHPDGVNLWYFKLRLV